MCRPASMIVTKDRVYWSKQTDSHSEIRDEFSLPHETCAQRIKTVAVEIAPDDGNLARPIDEWVYRVDQGEVPKWYDAERDEGRVRAALKDWVAARLVLAGQEITVFSGESVYVYGGTVKACGNATVQAWDNATVKAWDNATVKAWDNATVEAWDNATVKAYGNATVNAYDNATVGAWERSQVIAFSKLEPTILKSATAVLIDRSEHGKVRVFVGEEL